VALGKALCKESRLQQVVGRWIMSWILIRNYLVHVDDVITAAKQIGCFY
jgi:hypothetical protein